jgi:hypothetical protein
LSEHSDFSAVQVRAISEFGKACPWRAEIRRRAIARHRMMVRLTPAGHVCRLRFGALKDRFGALKDRPRFRLARCRTVGPICPAQLFRCDCAWLFDHRHRARVYAGSESPARYFSQENIETMLTAA